MAPPSPRKRRRAAVEADARIGGPAKQPRVRPGWYSVKMFKRVGRGERAFFLGETELESECCMRALHRDGLEFLIPITAFVEWTWCTIQGEKPRPPPSATSAYCRPRVRTTTCGVSSCTANADIAPLCPAHTELELGVAIRKSPIAGRGVFTGADGYVPPPHVPTQRCILPYCSRMCVDSPRHLLTLLCCSLVLGLPRRLDAGKYVLPYLGESMLSRVFNKIYRGKIQGDYGEPSCAFEVLLAPLVLPVVRTRATGVYSLVPHVVVADCAGVLYMKPRRRQRPLMWSTPCTERAVAVWSTTAKPRTCDS